MTSSTIAPVDTPPPSPCIPADVIDTTCNDKTKQKDERNVIIGATVSISVLLVLVAVAAVSVLLWLRKRREKSEAAVEQTVTSDDHIMESNLAYYLVQSRTTSAGVDTFPNSAYGVGLNAGGMIVSENEAYRMSNVVRGEVNDVSVGGDNLQYDYIPVINYY